MSKPITLWGPVTADTTAETVFTNVTGKAAILDAMTIANPSTGVATVVRLSVGTDVSVTTRVIEFPVPAGTGTYVIYPGITITGTTILQLSSTVSDDIVPTYGSGREIAV